MKKILYFIVMAALSLFVIFLCFLLGINFYKTITNSIGWVHQGTEGYAVMEFQKEENGCVYFLDVWSYDTKVCGAYSITRY
jgi:hypothetical protein